jgi:hypothetical protein
MAAGVMHIPWYATVFRGDKVAAALVEIAPVALRYGATDYAVYRSRDDMYKFVQSSTFERKIDFERYWYGPDFSAWRERYSGYYQVPVIYGWQDLLAAGSYDPDESWGEPVPEPAADTSA